MTVSIRRAGTGDADFLVELVTHADVEPFLASVGSKDRAEILAEIARSDDEPEAFGVFVIEVDGELAGTMRFTREGVRRKAYWRNGEWVDGVLYGALAEEVAD